MSKLPTLKKILREDMKDAPNWIETLLYPLNLFMETIYYALKNDITFEENIASFFKTITWTDDGSGDWIPLKFPNQLKRKPKAVFICKLRNLSTNTEPYSAGTPSLDWEYVDGEISITYFGIRATGHNYSMDLLII